MTPEIKAALEVLDRHNAAIVTNEGTSAAADAVVRDLAALRRTAPPSSELLKDARDQLERVGQLTMNIIWKNDLEKLVSEIDAALSQGNPDHD